MYVICVYVNVYICRLDRHQYKVNVIYIYIYVLCMYACYMYVCMYVCYMYVCMYMCTYVDWKGITIS